MKSAALSIVLFLAWSDCAIAQLNPSPDDVYVRIVDTGPGLCTITRIPGDPSPYFMIYDAGHWLGNECRDAVRELVHTDIIDLLVISHSDADHHGQAEAILQDFRVASFITTGDPRWDSATWKRTNAAIARQAERGSSIMNLQTVRLVPGTTLRLGNATVTLIAGWKEWTASGPTPSEKRNAISIVAKLEYAGKSVLFAGDTVGRRTGDPVTACKDAEKIMVERNGSVPLKADVIIAPHHGGNNGNAQCFIAAVASQFVVFSAGHDHEHPTAGAASRYLAQGVMSANMFRTDRGDDEGGKEWRNAETVNDCRDPRGDDDVEIVLPVAGLVQVAYRHEATGEC